jgi:short-subunit dehydrogenase
MSGEDFKDTYGPWALICGGSEGLGVAFAHTLAERGLNLVLVARKPEPLEATAAEVRARFGREVRALAMDLTDPGAAQTVLENTKGCDFGLLVFNAGADATFDRFLDRPIDNHERMAALNVLTPMRLVHALAPAMVARHKGGLIFLSSMASLAGYTGNLTYSASKAFSNLFAEGLWGDLGREGVDVLSAIIGLAKTPAMERLGLKFDGSAPYSEPFELVNEILGALKNGPTIHPGGMEERAQMLRSLPRAKATRTLSRLPEPEA